jgi:hypothetical protein
MCSVWKEDILWMKGVEHDWKNNQHIANMQQKPAFYTKKHI